MPYSIDTNLVRRSLELIKTLDFSWLVPSHGHPITKEESVGDIANHMDRIDAIEEIILRELAEARTTEEIIARTSAALELVENPAQYWLAVTTVKGFLGCLLERHLIEFSIRNHAGYWRTCA